jgi:hypothetical protein
MKTLAFLIAVPLLSLPALAQATPEPAASASVPAPQSTPAQPSMGQGAVGAQTPASEPTVSAAPANESVQLAAAVDEGFAKYDKDKSGALSSAEFKSWIADMKAREASAEGKNAASPAETRSYATSAWKAADKDKNGSVTKEELVTFLQG